MGLTHQQSTQTSKHRADILIAGMLCLGLWCLYIIIGEALQSTATAPYSYFDVFFELDTPRAMGDMLIRAFNHERTSVHPLHVLLVNPLGSLLSGLPAFQHAHFLLAIALNSFFGALSAAVAFALLRRMGGTRISALLLALCFALSMSQLIISIIPETASLAVLSHLLTYSFLWISLYGNGLALRWWILAGVLSLGITTTNVIQPLICYFVAQRASQSGSTGRAASKTGLLAVYVFSITAVLAVLQKRLYPSASLFFMPTWLHQETFYTNALALKEPLLVAEQLLKQFFVANLIGPRPDFIYLGQLLPVTTFSRSWTFSFAGYAALAAAIILAANSAARDHVRRFRSWYAGLGFCIAYNVVLHTIYGPPYKTLMEYFLYSGNVTGALVLMLLAGNVQAKGSSAKAGLACFVILLALNNAGVIRTIIKHYDDPVLAARAQEGWGAFDSRWKELDQLFTRYIAELKAIAAAFPGSADSLPWIERFYVFGMGERRALIYRDGELRDAASNSILARWHKSASLIVPPVSSVALRTTDGRFVYISEDENGIFIDENGSRRILDDRKTALPVVHGHRYPLVTQALQREILVDQGIGRVSRSTRDAALMSDALRMPPDIQDDFISNEGHATFSGYQYPLSWTAGRIAADTAHSTPTARELNAAGIIAPYAPNAARLLLRLNAREPGEPLPSRP